MTRPDRAVAISFVAVLSIVGCDDDSSGRGGQSGTGGQAGAAGSGMSGTAGSGTGATAGSGGGLGTGGTAGGTGGQAGAGGVMQPVCIENGDCRLFSDMCDGCTCLALPLGEPDPTCDGQIVVCVIDPCTLTTPECLMGECVASPDG